MLCCTRPSTISASTRTGSPVFIGPTQSGGETKTKFTPEMTDAPPRANPWAPDDIGKASSANLTHRISRPESMTHDCTSPPSTTSTSETGEALPPLPRPLSRSVSLSWSGRSHWDDAVLQADAAVLSAGISGTHPGKTWGLATSETMCAGSCHAERSLPPILATAASGSAAKNTSSTCSISDAADGAHNHEESISNRNNLN
mmetsp:Transcript_45342/g.111413  ORF Transcript_45342/g.111413 Transcript_45342/m.111413 type:complete len:201 (-) Transcript_45342:7-609(-)